MKYFGWFVLIIMGLFLFGIIFNTCNTASKFVNNGLKTAYEEFKPEELLRKYEWLKDAAAQCDAKLATLSAYEMRFKSLKPSYGSDSLKRRSWQRTDIEQWNVWESEYLGVKASYNDLVAQYNAAMVKFNYRFCNAGDLPAGATQTLPREFKPYITN